MCQPSHSIIQYPPHDDNDKPMGPMVEAITPREGKKSWLKKVLGWFHLSRVGRGHSGAVQEMRLTDRLLPYPTLYEGAWWSRETKIDGLYHFDFIPDSEAQALEAAEEYSSRVSYGSLPSLRRFLEASLKNTDNPHGYVDRLLSAVFNSTGRDAVQTKMKRLFKVNISSWSSIANLFGVRDEVPKTRDQAISCLMGFTRKRELFLPHWADDDKLWIPAKKRIALVT